MADPREMHINHEIFFIFLISVSTKRIQMKEHQESGDKSKLGK